MAELPLQNYYKYLNLQKEIYYYRYIVTYINVLHLYIYSKHSTLLFGTMEFFFTYMEVEKIYVLHCYT